MDIDHLFGDVWYRREVRPGQIAVWEDGKVQIPVFFLHIHDQFNSRKPGTGYILSSGDYSYCDICDKKFPSRKKLETMVGLKELTE